MDLSSIVLQGLELASAQLDAAANGIAGRRSGAAGRFPGRCGQPQRGNGRADVGEKSLRRQHRCFENSGQNSVERPERPGVFYSPACRPLFPQNAHDVSSFKPAPLLSTTYPRIITPITAKPRFCTIRWDMDAPVLALSIG